MKLHVGRDTRDRSGIRKSFFPSSSSLTSSPIIARTECRTDHTRLLRRNRESSFESEDALFCRDHRQKHVASVVIVVAYTFTARVRSQHGDIVTLLLSRVRIIRARSSDFLSARATRRPARFDDERARRDERSRRAYRSHALERIAGAGALG